MLISKLFDICKSGTPGRPSTSKRRGRSLREPSSVEVGRIESLEERLLLTVDLLNQTIVYNQGATFPDTFNFFTSSIDSNGTTGAVVYDNFGFTTTTSFDTVMLQGLFASPTAGANPAEPNTDIWRVNIWADNGFGTGPGTTLLLSENVQSEDSVGEFVGLTNIDAGVQVPVFNVAVGLSTDFVANANTQYWLSVISISAGANDPTWNWMSGSGGDGQSIQQLSDSSGNQLRAGDRAFRLGQSNPPPAPSITAPSAIVDAARPTLTWSAVPGADHYDVWVNVYGSNQLVVRNQNVSGTSFQPTDPLPSGKTYIWTVRAIAPSGTGGEWAAHSKFKVDVSLAAPTLTSPKGAVTSTTPEFSWSAVNGADHYHLWVNVYGPNTVAIYETNVSTNSFTPTEPLAAGTTYIWTVRALGANNAGGAWATHTTFKVTGSVGTPTLVSPTSVNTSTTPKFEWTAVTGAKYVVWVNVYGSNELVFRQADVATNSLSSPVPLTPGKWYIWTVQAVVNGVAGDWAAHRTFRVASNQAQLQMAPLLGQPTDDDEIVDRPDEVEETTSREPAIMLADNRKSNVPQATHARVRSAASSHAVPEASPDEVDLAMADWAGVAWWAPQRSDKSAIA